MDLIYVVAGILIAVILLYIGQRLKIPSIASFLVIGILVGPFCLALVTDMDAINTFADIGIVLLLFAIGLEFSFQLSGNT